MVYRVRFCALLSLLVCASCAPAPIPAGPDDGDPAGIPGSSAGSTAFNDLVGDDPGGSGGGDAGSGSDSGGTADDKPVTQGTTLPEVENEDTPAEDPVEAEFRVVGELLNFGSSSTLRLFNLESTGEMPVGYEIASTVPWLAISPSSGIFTDRQEVQVHLDRSALQAGSYSTELLVSTSTDRVEKVYVAAFQLADPEVPSDAQILAWMQDLQPLQKVHHSWPLPAYLYEDGVTPLLEEYVRLTHAASTDIEGITPDEMAAMVEVCNRVNAGNPSIPARISLNYSPWREVFPPEAPPTDFGPDHQAELDLYTSRLQRARDYLDQANAAQGSAVEVDVVFFDSERFFPKSGDTPEDQAWNDAIDLKYNLFYNETKAVFPNVIVDWYARGGIRRCARSDGWCGAPWYTLRELGDTYSVPLYTFPELGVMRDTFRNSVAEAQAAGVDIVTPWVSLGSGYDRHPTEFLAWRWDWNYNIYYSWQLGAELNIRWYGERPERYAPWGYAEYVYFYPEPFGRAPHWARHFVAYVRGANGNGALPPD